MASRDEYEFWLFDLDGTLVDVRPDYARRRIEEVGDRLGVEFTDYEKGVLWHGLSGVRRPHLSRRGVDPTEFWTAFHETEDAAARAEATFLYDDAAFVGDLDAPVGLVTHCQRYLTEPVLETLGIADWFDAVVCCTEDVGWKPDPAPVRAAMDRLGVDARQVATDGGFGRTGAPGVLAGDGPHDVGAAWNTGLDGIHVERHGHDRRGQCVLGDYRVTSFDELGFVPGE
ncbi:HAD family hydrolase [Halobacteriales archaeon QS_8_69_26]|nr:MAG: HAD family hydrolase [Halobacteriales archaeon QS_8_69_26]